MRMSTLTGAESTGAETPTEATESAARAASFPIFMVLAPEGEDDPLSAQSRPRGIGARHPAASASSFTHVVPGRTALPEFPPRSEDSERERAQVTALTVTCQRRQRACGRHAPHAA